MIHKCLSCGYIYDFEMEPSGFNENGDVVCEKCAKSQKIGTIMIDGSNGFHAIMTNDRKVFKKWLHDKGRRR